ncbi:MAG TPA: Gfo/Idh/MocA family oxidoreductase [Clostridiaceae bacterium]|nr:Gfo/Idh/MocA family oxidoreductase [Clostridiaceae bacterium]
MDKVRFGIIGCGLIAKSHAECIKMDKRAEFAAVCGGSSEKKARDFAKAYKVDAVYMDYKKMLKEADIDAICVCTPSGLHGENTVESAKAGKHVLCEKPLEIKKEKMDEMIEAARRNNVKLGVVFPNRTRAGLRKAKEILDSGELGKMTIVECQYRGYRSPQYYKSGSWRGTWELDGGGCLMNQGIHAIDAMCWLTGEVEYVQGISGALLRDIEVEDTAMALLEFKNGAKGVIMGTTISNIPETGPEGDRIRIECEKGSILYADGKTTLYKRDGDNVIPISLDKDDKEAVSSASDPANIDLEAHYFIVEDFISSILENRVPYITGESARKCVDLVLAIYESSKKGARVKVN